MGASLFKCCQPSTSEEVELNKPEAEEDPQSRDLVILKNMMSVCPSINLCFLVGFSDGLVSAVLPENYEIEPTIIKDLINFFKGKKSGLEEKFINFGSDTLNYVPGKMIDNVLYCVGTGKEAEEEEPDGCVILKTKSHLLIVCYTGDSEIPVRTAESSAHQMIDRNL